MKNYLLTRPVNALKKLYAPSYLGAKIRASKSIPSLAKITELAIEKRLHSSEGWAYKKFFVFKGIGEDASPEYREYLAPSPITSAAESYILNKIGSKLNHNRSKRVYSYVSTSEGATHNYEYYLNYYQQRNTEILDALRENEGSVAVFLDIKNFYASVNRSHLELILKKHSVFGLPENRFALDFSLQQIQQSPAGIPIGTEISHALADACLHTLDAELSKMLGKRYFRYVDDLTFVCTKSEVGHYEKFIKNYLNDIGLTLNNNKREILSFDEWAGEMDTSPVEGADFYAYCQGLGDWIDGDAKKLIWLEAELKNQGFQIPLKKISARTHTSNQSVAKSPKNEHQVISDSIELRQKYVEALDEISENLSSKSSRWYLQKTKRALNPLFYLLNKENYKTITRTAKESKSLKPQEEVSIAIRSGDCSEIIRYPGVTINTFCEIWKTTQPKTSMIDVFPEILHGEIELETATTLALFEIMAPHQDILNFPIWKALRPDLSTRSTDLPSFEAEIESIRIGIDVKTQRNFLENRLSSDEDVYLSALELGNQSISP